MSYLQPSYRSPRHRGLRRMRPFRPDIFDITPRMGFYPYGFDSMMREHNRAMYHMMQDMMSQDFGDFASMMPRSFKIDVEDKETEYLVTADMPGVQKDEIDIDFHNGRLTVSVDKHYDADDNQEEQEEISAEESKAEEAKAEEAKDAQDLDESKELSKQEDNQKHYIHRERMSYSASRRIFLKNSESEGIKASLKDGVLTIVVPKKAADKKDPHKIEIE